MQQLEGIGESLFFLESMAKGECLPGVLIFYWVSRLLASYGRFGNNYDK